MNESLVHFHFYFPGHVDCVCIAPLVYKKDVPHLLLIWTAESLPLKPFPDTYIPIDPSKLKSAKNKPYQLTYDGLVVMPS